MNGAVANGIEAGIDRIEEADDLWVGIITRDAAGVLCRRRSQGDQPRQRRRRATAKGGFGGITQRERTKPVIAAVDGPKLAGGTEITLACDLIVASVRRPSVSRGQAVAGRRGGGLFRLGRKIPFNLAMECG